MSATRRIVILGCLVSMACGSAAILAAEHVEQEIRFERTLRPGEPVFVENLLGSITVRGSERPGMVEIEARVVVEAKTREMAESLARGVEIVSVKDGDDEVLHVAFPVERHTAFRFPKSGFKGMVSKWVTPVVRKSTVATEYGEHPVEVGQSRGATAMAVHLEVGIPFETRAHVKQVVGTIDCEGWRGELSLETVEGKILVEQLYGSLEARTGSGEIELHRFQGDRLSLHTGTGDMDLRDVNAEETRLRSGSGHIHATTIKAGILRASTSSGDVRLEDAEPKRLEGTTVSGSFDVGTRLRGLREARIESDTGNVTLRVGKYGTFRLEVETESGAYKAHELPVEVEGNKKHGVLVLGQGGADLRVKTGSGRLVVRPM